MLENKLAETLSLNGEWQIEIAGQGGSVKVPGAWDVQGYPDVEGPAVYRRTVDVPAAWQGTAVMLRFGAVSYYADVAVNGVLVGSHEGLWTPFEFNVTDYIHAGETNTIELRITKAADDGDRFPYRDVLVGFIPYISTTFGGIWQDAELVAHRAPAFTGVHVAADSAAGTVTFSAQIEAFEGIDASIEIVDSQGQIVAQESYRLETSAVEATLSLENPQFWSPETPTLYTVRCVLRQEGHVVCEAARQVGFRRLHTEGDQLLLNGHHIFTRGVLSWGWNPQTLAPIFSDDEIRAEFRRIREMGFNLFKLCLYVPNPRLFEIADEEGMLLWLELPMWLPRLSDHLRQQAREEYHDILARVHHHPSIVIYSLGCELSADMADAELLGALDSMTRTLTHDALVCDNSGSGEAYGGVVRDLSDFYDYHFYCDLQYFTPLCDHFRRDWRPARPWIFGEFCDCDDYRDPAELLENGVRPQWRDLLGKDGGIHRWAYRDQEALVSTNGLNFSDAEIMRISRQQSFVLRKHILEKVRSRKDVGGYVITGLRDTPISTSGIFDDSGRSKFAPEAFRQFNAESVLLLEQGRKRIWQNGGDRPAPQDKFNHVAGSFASFRALLAVGGRVPLSGEFRWQFQNADTGETYAEGRFPVEPMPILSRLVELATIEFQIPQVAQAATCRLMFALDGSATLHNEWTMWVYPPPAYENAALDLAGMLTDFQTDTVLITSRLTPETEAFVRSGGRVIVLQGGEGLLPVRALPFWRESIKLINDHPALEGFPHGGFTDMQFYHLATDFAFDSAALRERFGSDAVTPIIQRLDARLFDVADYLVQIDIGQGTIYASTLRFTGGTGDQVQGLAENVAGQWLLSLLVNSLSSEKAAI